MDEFIALLLERLKAAGAAPRGDQPPGAGNGQSTESGGGGAAPSPKPAEPRAAGGAQPEKPKPTEPAGASPALPEKKTPAERFAKFGHVAASLLVVAVLGAAAFLDRLPATTSRRGLITPRFERPEGPALGEVPSARLIGIPRGRAPEWPTGGVAGVTTRLEAPAGVASPQFLEDGIELELREERLRERLRREGRLPPEPGSIEEYRQRFETAKESLIRFASQRGT